ncbi:MAG: serine/threonine protein kinase [Anaerolineae bacterium]|nr:serine/threonine protein kinase [Anaerolineae bacterium]
MLLQVGDQFDHFQIQAHIAQGGTADIYTAVDLMTGKEVAIKIPNQMMIGDPAQYERFRRELEVMKTLHHPSIQQGLDSGQFNRTPYLVTEWVNGKSMRDVVSEEAPMPPEKAIPLIRRIAEGMAYCHANGVVHRDMKPENVLIREDGQPVILDFGLALTKDAKRVTYANLSTAAGTPDYMSPEQCEGQRGDVRSDIYALGVMLYEVLAGKTPFAGDTSMAVMAGHLQGAIPRLDKQVARVSPQLAAVVAKALQKNPEERYPTMEAFVEALDHPELINMEILDTTTGGATQVPFWRSQGFLIVVVSLLVLITIIAIVLATQAMRGVG